MYENSIDPLGVEAMPARAPMVPRYGRGTLFCVPQPAATDQNNRAEIAGDGLRVGCALKDALILL